MAFEIEGTLYKKLDEQQVSEKFRKREFVMEIESGAYKEVVKFQLTQDRCDLINAFREGDRIKVSFDLTGKEFNGRDGKTIYFTNINAWRIEPAGTGSAAPGRKGSDADFPTADDAPPFFGDSGGSNEDLPF